MKNSENKPNINQHLKKIAATEGMPAHYDEEIDNKVPFWQRFVAGLNEFYHAPYRQTMARAARDEEDFFMLLMFSESLGIDNPASFYTLELQPLFLENFHEWHTRMGMDRCPFDHVGCC